MGGVVNFKKTIDFLIKIPRLIFMNNDLNKNTRTLIVSLAVAIFALIPLRFVEAGQQVQSNGAQILGEGEQVAEVVESVMGLEAPYSELETRGCITNERLASKMDKVTELLNSGTLDEVQRKALVDDLESTALNLCR